MLFKRKKIHNTSYEEMTLIDLVRNYFISRMPSQKAKISEGGLDNQPKLPEGEITYIAIVLDGVVEDVMRAQNRLAALVLSQPQFIEFDPTVDRPQIGETRFLDGKFQYPTKELMTDEEINKTLEGMGVDVKDENKKQ
jgi:hypothetical protein